MARYLSRAELSCIAGKYIEMYYALFGISKNDPAPINPEQFANSVLGLNLKMLPLCSDGHILGLTVFQRCSFTATLEDGTKLGAFHETCGAGNYIYYFYGPEDSCNDKEGTVVQMNAETGEKKEIKLTDEMLEFITYDNGKIYVQSEIAC